MNLANELDMALDEAVKRHIGRLFDTFFQSPGPSESKIDQLQKDLKQLGDSMEVATKVLEDT